jgi:SAM-dependent methyltransferase
MIMIKGLRLSCRLLQRVGGCARAISSRSDADCLSLLQQRLPELHDRQLSQFSPMWSQIVRAVAANNAAPGIILDLASGHGEPACTLAANFPSAEVVSSDNEQHMCERALHRVTELGLGGRVSVHRIDLLDIAALSQPGALDEPGLQCDVVTCSLGLFMLSAADQASCLGGIRTLLRPGGLLVASVWERMTLMEIGGRCMASALGQREPPPLPLDPESLGASRADELLLATGFEPAETHNELYPLRLTLGPMGSDEAWMIGLLPFAGALCKLAETPAAVPTGYFQRALSTFEEQVAECVDADGQVCVEVQYRLLCARSPWDPVE